MPEFKKGQLVAVRNSDEFGWKMFVYDHEEDGRHFCSWPEFEDWGATDWKYVRPAEEVWPEIFFGVADRQIEWLCSKLKGCSDAFGICPPNINACKDPWQDCQYCWRKTSFNATQETRNE